MKKIFALLTILCMVFSMTTAYAQTYTSDDLGISFIVSDDWYVSEQDEYGVVLNHSWSSNEYAFIMAVPVDDAYDVELLDEDFISEYCIDYYSNESLETSLNESNNTYGVNVTTEAEQSDYITLGGTTYYRYEKAYTATAPGFYDQGFYITALLTAKNGKIYHIEYSRDDDMNENHFADIVAMLESMSYSEGEIKIYIDGERVIADSAPIVIEQRTLVPIRAIAEKMGYKVSWDSVSQTAIISGKHNLAFTIDSMTAVKNSEEFILDVPALAFSSRTYLPLRAVTEAMDAQVEWNQYENAIYITSSAY